MVTCPTYPEKFIQDDAIALSLVLSVVIMPQLKCHHRIPAGDITSVWKESVFCVCSCRYPHHRLTSLIQTNIEI